MKVDIYITRESRFDDTNPEAEKQEYIDHIHEIVNWMGWKPFKVLLHFPLKVIRKLNFFLFGCSVHVVWDLSE